MICEMCEQERDDVECHSTNDDAFMLCATCVSELRGLTTIVVDVDFQPQSKKAIVDLQQAFTEQKATN